MLTKQDEMEYESLEAYLEEQNQDNAIEAAYQSAMNLEIDYETLPF